MFAIVNRHLGLQFPKWSFVCIAVTSEFKDQSQITRPLAAPPRVKMPVHSSLGRASSRDWNLLPGLRRDMTHKYVGHFKLRLSAIMHVTIEGYRGANQEIVRIVTEWILDTYRSGVKPMTW